MSAIFISHNSRDNTKAAEVKARLAEQGYRSVFLDFDPEVGIPAGRNWEKELYARLRRCQAIIVLFSEHFVASQWCFAEITLARSLGKSLFPLKIDACQIPPLLRDIQVIDFMVDPAAGYQRLWSGLRKAGLDPVDIFDWDGARPPYPGLLAFQEQDAAIYFGRDATIHKALERLNGLQRYGGSRLMLVLGASGSGKSSLVRAGIVPRLKRDKDRWLVLEPFRPLGRPLAELAVVLARAFRCFGDIRDWESLRVELATSAGRHDATSLLGLANRLRIASGQREASLLLIIDQFEELLGHRDNTAANDFLHLLKAVLNEPYTPFLAIATLRSDFLGQFQTHEALQDLENALILLPHMTKADFVQVIEGPARVAGLELEAGLAQAMAEDTETEDALPLLAFALRELWEKYGGDARLTLAGYRDGLGGLQESIARAAEATCAQSSLSAEQERQLRKALLLMVRIDKEGRYVRKPARWTEMPAAVHEILGQFIAARLLVSRSQDEIQLEIASESTIQHRALLSGETGRILEAAHEALFRTWKRLKIWLDEDQEFLLWQQRLQTAVEEWQRTRQDPGTLLRGALLDEAQRWRKERSENLSDLQQQFIRQSLELCENEKATQRRRRNIFFGGLAAFVLIVTILAGVAWSKKQEAQQQLAMRYWIDGVNERDRNNHPLTASHYFMRAASLTNDSANSRNAYLAAAALTRNTRLAAILEYSGKVYRAVFHHDESQVLTWCDDGTVRVWNSKTGKQLATLENKISHPHQLVFNFDGSRVLSWDNSGVPRLWDIQSGDELNSLPYEGTLDGAVFSHSSKLILTWSKDNTVQLWNIESGAEPRELSRFKPQGTILGAVFDNNDDHVLIWYEGGTTQLWDSRRGQQLTTPVQPDVAKVNIVGVIFFKDNQRLIAWTEDGYARIWDWKDRTGKKNVEIHHDQRIRGVVISQDEQRILTWSEDGTARLWDSQNATELARFSHGNRVLGAIFSNDEHQILTWSEDHSARLWESDNGIPLSLPLMHESSVRGAVFNADETQILTWSDSGVARIWSNNDPHPFVVTLSHKQKVLGAVFRNDDEQILTWTADGMLLNWSGKGKLLSSYLLDPDIIGAAVAPNQNRIVIWTKSHSLRVWNSLNGHALTSSFKHAPSDFGIQGAVFSQDARLVLSWGDDRTARLWDIDQEKEILTLWHMKSVSGALFSKDEKQILTWSNMGSVQLWDRTSGNLLVTLPYSKEVTGVALSKDSRWILIWNSNGTLQLWDRENTKQPIIIYQHQASIEGATFSKDADSILAWSADGIIQLWDRRSGKGLLQLLQNTNVGQNRNAVQGALLNSDESQIITWGDDGTVRLWNRYNGQLLISPLKHKKAVGGVALGHDEQRLLSWSDNLVELWDLKVDYISFATDPVKWQEILTGTKLSDNIGEVVLLSSTEWTKRK